MLHVSCLHPKLLVYPWQKRVASSKHQRMYVLLFVSEYYGACNGRLKFEIKHQDSGLVDLVLVAHWGFGSKTNTGTSSCKVDMCILMRMNCLGWWRRNQQWDWIVPWQNPSSTIASLIMWKLSFLDPTTETCSTWSSLNAKRWTGLDNVCLLVPKVCVQQTCHCYICWDHY